MDLVDIKDISAGLFVTGAIFILLIGSFLSLGVLRFFQLQKKQGFTFIALSVVMFVGLIVVVETWFA